MRSDQFEQEVEYERLCDSLTGKGSDELALRLHAAHVQIGGGSKLIHLHAVSELAAQYVDHYYNGHDFNEHRYWSLGCRLTGLLHEAMEWGGTFEDVVAVADETVARLVASLTADRRLPKPKRLELLANKVGLAAPAAQLVKLADMQHDCFHLCGLNLHKESDAQLNIISDWLDEARLLLRSMARIRESMEIDNQVADFYVKLSELGANIGEAWKKRSRRRKR
jgi:hypothetical protein